MIDHNPYMRPAHQTDVGRVESLLYFVFEREAIRIARENGLPREQWTADPVFRKYKFTNVRRRDDRVSQWILKHISEPRHADADLWFSLLIARLVNWPPTLQHLLKCGVMPRRAYDFNRAEFISAVEEFKSRGNKTYSSAYMTFPGKLGYKDKSEFLARVVLSEAANNHYETIHRSLWGQPQYVADFVGELSKCFGVSTFMAGQVAADLTYVPAQLGKAGDLYKWAPLGPGSQFGLNVLFGKSRYHRWAQSDFNRALTGVREQVETELEITGLTLHDVQNVMCEYGKYAGFLRDGKHPKIAYQPQTEF